MMRPDLNELETLLTGASALCFDEPSEIIDDSLKRIKPKRLTNGRAEVGIRIDIEEDQTAIGGLQIFNTSYIETSGCHDFFAHCNGKRRHLRVG